MNQKSNKGITLIALVITIIVLLILAGVTLNIVLGDNGIIARAQQANEAQKNAEKADQEAIDLAAAQVDKYTEGTPAYYAAREELKVGDYITYNYTSDIYTTTLVDDDGVSQSFNSGTDDAIANTKWRVLSTDNGIIQIMPDIREVPKLTMYGAKAYLNAEKVLNEMCETLYSGDYGTARSIEIGDIDKKVGYKGTVAYTKDGTLITIPSNITTLAQLENTTGYKIKAEYRKTPDGSKLNDNLKPSYYSYSVVESSTDGNVPAQSYETIDMSKCLYSDKTGQSSNIALWEMLGLHSGAAMVGGTDNPFWLANSVEDISLSSTNADNSYIKYGVRIMHNAYLNRAHLWNAKEGAQDGDTKRSYGVVPVVTLKSGLQVEKNGTVWEIK